MFAIAYRNGPFPPTVPVDIAGKWLARARHESGLSGRIAMALQRCHRPARKRLPCDAGRM